MASSRARPFRQGSATETDKRGPSRRADVHLRAMTDADTYAVLSLNASAVDVTGPLDQAPPPAPPAPAPPARRPRRPARADVVEVDGWVTAFAIVLPPGTDYDS